MILRQKVPINRLYRDEEQARKEMLEEALRRLGLSMQTEGQLQDLLVTHREHDTFDILDGNCRHKAAELVGIPELWVTVLEGEVSLAAKRRKQLAANVHRSDLKAHEKANACKELLELNNWTSKQLSEHVHLDASSVTRLLSVFKCIPEVQEALRLGQIGITDCYAMSKLEPEKQHGLLALKLSGSSRDDLERAVKKAKSASKPTVKTSSLKVSLPGGLQVIIKGEAIDFDGGIEAMREAIKAVTKARDSGLNPKTAQKAWADMAKAV